MVDRAFGADGDDVDGVVWRRRCNTQSQATRSNPSPISRLIFTWEPPNGMTSCLQLLALACPPDRLRASGMWLRGRCGLVGASSYRSYQSECAERPTREILLTSAN